MPPVVTAPAPAIPEKAHRAVRIAMRFLDRAKELQAETVSAAKRAGTFDRGRKVVQLHPPREVVELLRRSGKYRALAIELMLTAERLADEAGVPRYGRATPPETER